MFSVGALANDVNCSWMERKHSELKIHAVVPRPAGGSTSPGEQTVRSVAGRFSSPISFSSFCRSSKLKRFYSGLWPALVSFQAIPLQLLSHDVIVASSARLQMWHCGANPQLELNITTNADLSEAQQGTTGHDQVWESGSTSALDESILFQNRTLANPTN